MNLGRNFGRYYDAFDAYYRTGSAELMTLLVAEYVDAQLGQYLDILK